MRTDKACKKSIRKGILFLCVFFLITTIPFVILADVNDVFEADGLVYKVLTENGDIGTIQVGTGVQGEIALVRSTDSLVIPAKVTNGGITYTVTCIGDYAFYDLWTLKNVSIPYGVANIGKAAFSLCDGLNSITIPGSVEVIGESAFANCYGLNNAIISEGVKTIGDYAFEYCEIREIRIPASVEIIGDYSFQYNCFYSSVSGVYFAGDAPVIGRGAFQGINLGSNSEHPVYAYVTREAKGFPQEGGGSPRYVDEAGDKSWWPLRIKYYESHLDETFWVDDVVYSILPEMSTDEGVVVSVEVGQSGCLLCGGTALRADKEEINIPSAVLSPWETEYRVTRIGDIAFDMFWPLGYDPADTARGPKAITIPDSVTSIGSDAFNGCGKITSITIPGSVASLGYGAFADCGNLAVVYFEGDAPEVSIYSFGDYQLYPFSGVAPGAIAYVYRSASGFPAEGEKWCELIVTYMDSQKPDAISISFVESSKSLGFLSWDVTNISDAAVPFTSQASGQANSAKHIIGAGATIQLRAAKVPGENKMAISWDTDTGLKTAVSFALDFTVQPLIAAFDIAPNKNYHDWIVENPNDFRISYQYTILETGISAQKSTDPGVGSLRILSPQMNNYTMLISWNDEYGIQQSLRVRYGPEGPGLPIDNTLSISFVESSKSLGYLSWDVINSGDTAVTFTSLASGQTSSARHAVEAGATLQLRAVKVPGENKMEISWDTDAGIQTVESFAVDYIVKPINAGFDNEPNKNYHDWIVENPNDFRVAYQYTVLETGASGQKSIDTGSGNLRILSPQLDNYTILFTWNDEYGQTQSKTIRKAPIEST